MKTDAPHTEDDRFVISRIFNAPRTLVWDAWTVPERIGAWLGPQTGTPPRVIRHEFEVGGVFLTAMRLPDGSEICAKFVYREITPISRLVGTQSTTDVNGEPARHPMLANWPQELLRTVSFADLGDRTEVTLEWVPIHASSIERQTFSDSRPNMTLGWTASFDQLAKIMSDA